MGGNLRFESTSDEEKVSVVTDEKENSGVHTSYLNIPMLSKVSKQRYAIVSSTSFGKFGSQ